MNEQLKDVLDRARGNLSMADFASKCGISTNTIYRWLRGNQKTALRKDVIQKIYNAAIPGSITEGEIYDASLMSIKSADRRRFSLQDEREKIEEILRNRARDMYSNEDPYLKEEIKNADRFDCDYMLQIKDKATICFELIAAPVKSYRTGPKTAWWLSQLRTIVGRHYLDPHGRNFWTHVVIAVNTSDEAKEAKETLQSLVQHHLLSFMKLSVLILDLEKRVFADEIEIGANRSDFFENQTSLHLERTSENLMDNTRTTESHSLQVENL